METVNIDLFEMIPNPLILPNSSKENQVRFWVSVDKLTMVDGEKDIFRYNLEEFIRVLDKHYSRGEVLLFSVIYSRLHKALQLKHNLKGCDYTDDVIHYTIMGGFVQFNQSYNNIAILANHTKVIIDTVIRLNNSVK